MAPAFHHFAASLVCVFLAAGHAARPADSAKTYKATILPITNPSFYNAGRVRLVGGSSMQGTATVVTRKKSLSLFVTASGSIPGNGDNEIEPFNPKVMAATFSLHYTADGLRSASVLSFMGSWSALTVNKSFRFSGVSNVDASLSKGIDAAEGNYSVVLKVPPSPDLSDFLYASAGVLEDKK